MTNRRPADEQQEQEHPATQSRFASARKVGDVTDESLWPDLPQVELDTLKGKVFLIEDVRSIKTAAYETPFYVMKCVDGEGEYFTTGSGAGVVAKKLADMKAKGVLPVASTVWQQTEKIPAGRTGYFDLRSPEAGMPDFVRSAS